MHEFRFRTKAQLQRLFVGLQFPINIVLDNGHKFHGEEVMLLSLFRFHRPTTFYDLQCRFGIDASNCGRAFKWFCNYINENWGYLLSDHMNYWKPQMGRCCEHIRRKLSLIIQNEVLSIQENHDEGFKIFAFIDNTITAICRPGGGPVAPGGPGAERHDTEYQQAFYTKFKKIHGLKYQVVCLPNGMYFHVFGALEARRHDLINLHNSNILFHLETLQQDFPVKFKLHGDGAYDVVHEYLSGGPFAPRVTEEWSFGDFKTVFSFIDFKKDLKLFEADVPKIIFVAMLLYNSYVSLIGGNEISNYFDLHPPSFESWIQNGPADAPVGNDNGDY